MKKQSRRTTAGAEAGRVARPRADATPESSVRRKYVVTHGQVGYAPGKTATVGESVELMEAQAKQLVADGVLTDEEGLGGMPPGPKRRVRGDASNARVFNRSQRLVRDRVRLLNAAWAHVPGFKESLVELHKTLGKGGPQGRELLEDVTFESWLERWRLASEVNWVFFEIERFLQRDKPRRFPVLRVIQTDDEHGSAPRRLLPPEPVLRASQIAMWKDAVTAFLKEAREWNELAGLAGDGAEEPGKKSRDENWARDLEWLAMNRIGRMSSNTIADHVGVDDGETVKKAIQRAASALQLGPR